MQPFAPRPPILWCVWDRSNDSIGDLLCVESTPPHQVPQGAFPSADLFLTLPVPLIMLTQVRATYVYAKCFLQEER